MNSYSKLYLVKIPMAYLVRSDEEYKRDVAYGVLENMTESAFDNGDNISFGEMKIEEVF